MTRKISWLAIVVIAFISLPLVSSAQKPAPLHYLVINADNNTRAKEVSQLLASYGSGQYQETPGQAWNAKADAALNTLFDAMFRDPLSVGIIYYSASTYSDAALSGMQREFTDRLKTYTEEDERLLTIVASFFMKLSGQGLNDQNNNALPTADDVETIPFDLPNLIIITEAADGALETVKAKDEFEPKYFFAFSNKFVYSKGIGNRSNSEALLAYLQTQKKDFVMADLLDHLVVPSQTSFYFVPIQNAKAEYAQSLSGWDKLNYNVLIKHK